MILEIHTNWLHVAVYTSKKEADINIRFYKRKNMWLLWHPYEFNSFSKTVHMTEIGEVDWIEYKFLWFSIC